MRSAATFLIGAALFAGCNASDTSTDGPSSGNMSPSSATPAKKSQPYFEMTGADGNTYVFGSVASMMDYQKTQKLPAMTTHYNKGKSVQVEEAQSAYLITEYESQHK